MTEKEAVQEVDRDKETDEDMEMFKTVVTKDLWVMLMAKVLILQINLVELKFQATKMASTLDHHLLKIRDLSIKSAKTMTTTNHKTLKMKTQK